MDYEGLLPVLSLKLFYRLKKSYRMRWDFFSVGITERK